MHSAPKTSHATRNSAGMSQTLVSRNKPHILTVQKNRTRKVSQSQIDGTCYRLSKPAQIKTTIAPLNQQYERYSVRYFREHPEEDDDLRTCKEKLMDLDNIEEGTSKETFKALAKQKILRAIEYGEHSKEVVESHISLGRYYQNTDRPQSAIRHYTQGKEISKITELSSPDSNVALCVGLAESHMSLRSEGKKHISQAQAAIEEVKDCDVIDANLHFRRDKIRAEIAYEQKEENCCDLFITAEQTMVDNCLEDESIETADFYFKIANVLNEYNEKDKIEKYAKTAAELYRKLDKENEAAAAESLIPIVEEESEKEEKNNDFEGNDENTENNENNEKSEENKENDENTEADKGKEEEEEEEKKENGRISGIILDTLENSSEHREDPKDIPEVTFDI